MAASRTLEKSSLKPLRLWPGVAIVSVQLLVRYIVPIVAPDLLPLAVMSGFLSGLAIVVWWAFFSRAPRAERWGGVVLMVVALIATSYLLDESIAKGAMGLLFPLLAVPILALAFVAWAVVSRRIPEGLRRATMVATILVACLPWALLRTGGFTMDLDNDFHWRWSQTPEDRLVASMIDEPANDNPARERSLETQAEWPGFRGPGRDGIITGLRIKTDWSNSPPIEIWRRPIGPGWSSFAVHDDRVYTQEQRGDDEVVTCYSATSGEPIWRHRDATRFWESNGGAGPRGTPTLSGGRVYTFGGTGVVNALDAANGSVIWTRNAATDTDAKLPMWGYSSSPLVVDDVVIVAASSKLVAYDAVTGEPHWFGPARGGGYSSPHLSTIDGVAQIVQLSGNGVVGVALADGALLWEHPWPGDPIVQPALTANGDLLISVSPGSGTRRLAIARGPDEWTVEERWTSMAMRSYSSDFVVHDGHAYGFDGSTFACIDVENGEAQWRGERYGLGQLVLLAEQNLLLVVSEKGELALVQASPDRFTELARFPAVAGKTWGHPALVGDLLLVRNAQEMVAFRLSLAG